VQPADAPLALEAGRERLGKVERAVGRVNGARDVIPCST